MTDLRTRACRACEGDVEILSRSQCDNLVSQLDAAWALAEDGSSLSREFKFLNFDQTMAFVNALAWVARKDNHHPDINAGYNYCNVTWTTHALGGLSENDFICAAKTDALLEN
jgi:4a-hydroxytetrahydrobiopterin dehydratase